MRRKSHHNFGFGGIVGDMVLHIHTWPAILCQLAGVYVFLLCILCNASSWGCLSSLRGNVNAADVRVSTMYCIAAFIAAVCVKQGELLVEVGSHVGTERGEMCFA